MTLASISRVALHDAAAQPTMEAVSVLCFEGSASKAAVSHSVNKLSTEANGSQSTAR